MPGSLRGGGARTSSCAPILICCLEVGSILGIFARASWLTSGFWEVRRRIYHFSHSTSTSISRTSVRNIKSFNANGTTRTSTQFASLVAALAGVAEREDLVNEMVRKVKKGVYECQIFNGGRRHTMLLDDYFPCFTEAGPVFSRNRGGNLWVSLVEKGENGT